MNYLRQMLQGMLIVNMNECIVSHLILTLIGCRPINYFQLLWISIHSAIIYNFRLTSLFFSKSYAIKSIRWSAWSLHGLLTVFRTSCALRFYFLSLLLISFTFWSRVADYGYPSVFITRQHTDARYWYSNSVRPSVRYVPVFYGNGWTHCHMFFTTR